MESGGKMYAVIDHDDESLYVVNSRHEAEQLRAYLIDEAQATENDAGTDDDAFDIEIRLVDITPFDFLNRMVR